MKKKEKFAIDKAIELAKIYHDERHYKRESILKQLIAFQEFCGRSSILKSRILLSKSYKKRIVKKVLKDLNYKLTFFHNGYHGKNATTKTTLIRFK